MKSKQRNNKSSKMRRPNKRLLNQSASPANFSKLRFQPTSGGSFLPLNTRQTHQYYEQVNFSAVTTPQAYIYRGNSPYDPNQTGTGVQPVGWDQMLTFYSSSFCIGSRIILEVFNSSNVPLQISLTPTLESTTLSNFNDAKIFPKTKVLVIDGASRGGRSFGTFSHTANTTVMLNTPFDRDFIATGQAVSGKQWYWTITMQSCDQATAITAQLQIKVVYDVAWFDRKLVGLS